MCTYFQEIASWYDFVLVFYAMYTRYFMLYLSRTKVYEHTHIVPVNCAVFEWISCILDQTLIVLYIWIFLKRFLVNFVKNVIHDSGQGPRQNDYYIWETL